MITMTYGIDCVPAYPGSTYEELGEIAVNNEMLPELYGCSNKIVELLDMKKVGNMKLYSLEELLEEDYGKVGTPERDAFERSVDEAVQAYRVGEAIRQAREAQKLTQAELGEKMGVQRAQVCRLESGKSITLASMMRAFRALGVQVALEMKGIGKVAL